MQNNNLRFALILLLLLTTNFKSQESQSLLTGVVTDSNGDFIFEATVIVIDRNKKITETFTNRKGEFLFTNLSEGNYTLLVKKKGFATYEIHNLAYKKNTSPLIKITLNIKIEDSNVDVSENLNRPNILNNDTTVLTERELEKLLPDDSDDIAKYLKLLAGDSGGPDGATIYVDGFINSRVPPKSAIAEVRIDNNPFSAEYEKIGIGVINIFTKISSRKMSGSVNTTFNDESLNARNPFALTRAPSQLRVFGGSLSGTLLKKKLAFSSNLTRRDFNNSTNINAKVVDKNFNLVPFRENYLVPLIRTLGSGNLDFQLNSNNTLRIGYDIWQDSGINQGIGNLTIFTAGRKTSINNSTVRISQTSVIKNKFINEFRFLFQNIKTEGEGVSNDPRIVTDTFISGNSLSGRRTQKNYNFEINDIFTFQYNNFTFRVGGNIRTYTINDSSPDNFRGTYSYNGGFGPILNNFVPILDSNGQPIIGFISGVEKYRRTLFFTSKGLSTQQIRALGGGISQFSVNLGDPSIKLSQMELGGFFHNTWMMRSNISFSSGGRIDSQNHVKRILDISPRVAFAWSPFEKGKATVIRGGMGWYYERVPLSLRIQPEKIKQNKIQSYLTNDSTILDKLGTPPILDNLIFVSNSKLQTLFSNDLSSPYFFQSAISLEQELPVKWKFSATFTRNTGRGLLRSRNIARQSSGRLYQYESTGIFNSNALTARVSKQFKNYSLFINYRLGSSKSDTDGPQTFPINQFDTSNEYGNSSFDTKQSIYLGGFLIIPYNISISPTISLRSGSPFNITLGQDLNQDSIFTDRPAFADGKIGNNIITTTFGDFDLNPTSNLRVIPRNFGRGPASISMDLNISKDFNLFKNKGGTRQIKLNLGSQIINVLNSINRANPIGVLSSPFFGKSISDSSNGIFSGARTVSFNARLSF